MYPMIDPVEVYISITGDYMMFNKKSFSQFLRTIPMKN